MIALVGLAMAADATAPHEHRGIVSAYSGAPPAVSLTATDIATLEGGDLVQKQIRVDTGGRGVAVMHVEAPPATIWKTIQNYSAYPEWVDGLDNTRIYKSQGDHVYVEFSLSKMGIGIDYFIDHTVQTDAGWVTWTLDYDRQSDLDDSVGYWRVTQLSDSPVVSRVEYSVDLRVKGWVPGFIETLLMDKGLVMATSWVKTQAEAATSP